MSRFVDVFFGAAEESLFQTGLIVERPRPDNHIDLRALDTFYRRYHALHGRCNTLVIIENDPDFSSFLSLLAVPFMSLHKPQVIVLDASLPTEEFMAKSSEIATQQPDIVGCCFMVWNCPLNSTLHCREAIRRFSPVVLCIHGCGDFSFGNHFTAKLIEKSCERSLAFDPSARKVDLQFFRAPLRESRSGKYHLVQIVLCGLQRGAQTCRISPNFATTFLFRF